ncbi:hypothetical protein LSH36_511g01005 [Paralvinella palmiformis]|uniref:Uncharacterized protein n=1 Tax=Paralvinella palmiformis TaxID=53620 RepID=A0AAD9MWM2_9ANNE|nr:hypothetical protein LSH36_511g01005 [Paralvinella palmiformis]
MLLALLIASGVLHSGIESLSLHQSKRNDVGYIENADITDVFDTILWQELCRDYDGPAAYCRDLVRELTETLLTSNGRVRAKRADLLKQVPPLCPQNMDRLECFERYMAFIVRFHPKIGGGLKRNILFQEHVGPIFKRNLAWTVPVSGGDERAMIWNLCPSGWSKLDCFTEYLTFLLAVDGDIAHRTKRSGGGSSNLKAKRAAEGTSLCPAGVDPVTCFEGYFAYYINRGSDMKMIGRSSDNFVSDGERGKGESTIAIGDGTHSKGRNSILCNLDGSC